MAVRVRLCSGVGRRMVAGLLVAVALALLVAVRAPLPERLTVPPSPVVAYRDGSPAHVFLAPDDRYRMATRLEQVDPEYLAALLRFEDKRFSRHHGVDPIAVVRSAVANVRHGRVMSGASTITMQLVRLLEPRPRTLWSKAVEAVRAWQIELRLSKDEVLAAYLTFLPFGGNVEGLETACWAYFGHGAGELTADEIAVLLAVPQRPARRAPGPENRDRLRRARDEVARFLAGEEALPTIGAESQTDALARLLARPVPVALRPVPREAPHAATWLLARAGNGAGWIETTLDRGTQRLVERRMASEIGPLARLGVHNGAAVVVDHRTAEVRGLVGNLDFWDDRHGGQIVGFATPRSPGSALKPFVYAMAIESGLALPEQLVADTPVAYGSYQPRNYDGRFVGLLPLEDALSHSLNVPFVRLLGRVGLPAFLGTLRAAGVRSLHDDPGYYGLSAAIGAVELTPLDLALLYTALAADGQARPVRIAGGEPSAEGVRLLRPGVAWLVRRALARRDRPDFPERNRIAGLPAAIHWKTGTSVGHRDAWAAGSGPAHTAVVWLGNFDQSPSVDLVGADLAGPILFDLLEAIDRGRRPSEGGPPADLWPVEVCAYSGHVPSAACPTTETVLALRDHVPTERCPYHRLVDVDLDTGLALHAGCRHGRRWATRSVLVWPDGIRRYLGARHQVLPSPPPVDPACDRTVAVAPEIVTPRPYETVVLLAGLPASTQEIPLEAETGGLGGRLSWFVDGALVGTSTAGERVWWEPSPGEHDVVVVDERGGSARRVVRVLRRRSGSTPS